MTRQLASRALLCALPLVLVACATQTPPPTPQPEPPQVVEPVAPAPSTPVVSSAQPIDEALPAFVTATSAKYDVDAAYIEAVLAQAEIRDSIITAMTRPAEAKP